MRDTGALLGPSHGTGEYQPRGEQGLLGGCSSWRDTVKARCIISSASSEEYKQRRSFCFFNLLFFFCAHHEGTNQDPKATVVSTCRKYSKTAFNWPCAEQQRTYGSTFVSTRVRQRKQEGVNEQVKCCRDPCTSILCFCFSSFFFVVSV